MIARRALFSTCLTAGIALTIAAPDLSALAVACEDGPAKGTWELPSGSGTSDGYIDGLLFLAISPSNQPRYYFNATLTDTPTPCLSCIAGKINGFLDDGFGPAPDYYVRGTYSGTWLSGKGTFAASIYPLTGTHPVGKIEGTFSDPPVSTTPGTFKGDWKICP